MAKNDDARLDAERKAVRDALASVPPGAARLRASSPSPGRPRGAPLAAASASRGVRDDEAVIKQITALGSHMTRRLEEVDHRLDAVAELLENLLSTLLDLVLSTLPEDGQQGQQNGDPGTSPSTDQASDSVTET